MQIQKVNIQYYDMQPWLQNGKVQINNDSFLYLHEKNYESFFKNAIIVIMLIAVSMLLLTWSFY